MTTIRVVENVTTPLPELRHEDFPDPLPKQITLTWQRGQLAVRCEGIAGTIPLLNGKSLEILPKVGGLLFHRMVSVVHGDRRTATEFLRDTVRYGFTSEPGIPTPAVRGLVDAAGRALALGPLAGRRPTAARRDYVTGRVDLPATQRALLLRSASPVHTKLKVRDTDLPANRVVAEALRRVVANVPEDLTWAHQRARTKWGGLCSRLREDDLPHVRAELAAGAFRGPRDFYDPLVRVALVVLDAGGFTLNGNAVSGEAMLVSTADIFEKYTRTLVTRGAVLRGLEVHKAVPGEKALYVDGSQDLLPDMVTTRRSKAVLVADAKYKAEPSSSDHYQMNTYLHAFGVKRGVMLAVSDDVSVRVMRHKTTGGVEVVELWLPLGDLAETEDILGNFAHGWSVS